MNILKTVLIYDVQFKNSMNRLITVLPMVENQWKF